MLFMHSLTPSKIIDKLIQYEYKSLHLRFHENPLLKVKARYKGDIKNKDLTSKIEFKYKRINSEAIPFTWINIWNLLSLKGKKCNLPHHKHPENFSLNMKHMLEILEEKNFFNVIDKLLVFLDNEVST